MVTVLDPHATPCVDNSDAAAVERRKAQAAAREAAAALATVDAEGFAGTCAEGLRERISELEARSAAQDALALDAAQARARMRQEASMVAVLDPHAAPCVDDGDAAAVERRKAQAAAREAAAALANVDAEGFAGTCAEGFRERIGELEARSAAQDARALDAAQGRARTRQEERKPELVTVRSMLSKFELLASAAERARRLVGEAAQRRLECGTGGSETAEAEAEASKAAQAFEALRRGAAETGAQAATAARGHPLAAPGEAELLDQFAAAAWEQARCHVDWAEMSCDIAAPPPPPIAGFPRGEKVIVKGLQSRSDFNGKEGTIVGYEPARERYQVAMVGDRALLRAVNIELAGKPL